MLTEPRHLFPLDGTTASTDSTPYADGATVPFGLKYAVTPASTVDIDLPSISYDPAGRSRSSLTATRSSRRCATRALTRAPRRPARTATGTTRTPTPAGRDPVTVLILTHWFDPTADHVIEELNRRDVPVFRCDLADFPQQLTVTAELDGAWTGTLRGPSRQLGLREVSGVLYRRPTAFDLPAGLSEQARQWATAEARLGFGGLLASLDKWLNHPQAVTYAEYKPVQLQAATQCGLIVPRTLITNDPKQAHAFCEQVGDVIYKPLASNHVDQDGEARMVYAARIPPGDFGDPSIAHTAHLFQEWVEHDYAVRVAVVDGRFFATAIHAHSDAAHVDWRSDYDALTYAPVELPEHVRRGVRTMMGRLGLRFGALDFLVRPDGTHVYLEINSNGQWAWIEHTASAMAAAIADALTRGRPDE